MSGIAPRNASVTVHTRPDGERWVEKHYHRVYSVADEAAAYARLGRLLQGMEQVRTAVVHEVDVGGERLLMEYVDGGDLYQRGMAGDLSPLRRWMPVLLELCRRAYDEDVAFDCDPSNLLLAEGRELVLVDPVCQDLGLRHHAFVVLYWGILKMLIRSWRIWRWPNLYRMAGDLIAAYLGSCRDSELPASLEREIAAYITRVRQWNWQISPRDSAWVVLLRRGLVAPVYVLVAWLLRPTTK